MISELWAGWVGLGTWWRRVVVDGLLWGEVVRGVAVGGVGRRGWVSGGAVAAEAMAAVAAVGPTQCRKQQTVMRFGTGEWG